MVSTKVPLFLPSTLVTFRFAWTNCFMLSFVMFNLNALHNSAFGKKNNRTNGLTFKWCLDVQVLSIILTIQ